MTESIFQTKFNRWIKYRFNKTAVFELKVEKTSTFNLSKIRDHQISSLLAAKHGKLVYKIPDIGNSRKPFDCFVFNQVQDSFVVIYYEIDGVFFLFDIDVIVGMLNNNIKSLKLEEAYKISTALTFS